MSKNDQASFFESSYFHLEFLIDRRPLEESAEDRDLIHDFTGKILCETDEEGQQKSKVITIGRIRGQKLDLCEACERRCSMFQVCDGESQELYDIYEAIFDHHRGNEIREDLDLDSFGDVLIIHDMKIAPKYRGHKLGLLAMLQTIKTMGGGCSMAVIKPFPLQFSGEVTEKNQKKFDAALKKLNEYWERVGFIPIKGEEYYYLDLAKRLPKFEDLLGVKQTVRDL